MWVKNAWLSENLNFPFLRVVFLGRSVTTQVEFVSGTILPSAIDLREARLSGLWTGFACAPIFLQRSIYTNSFHTLVNSLLTSFQFNLSGAEILLRWAALRKVLDAFVDFSLESDFCIVDGLNLNLRESLAPLSIVVPWRPSHVDFFHRWNFHRCVSCQTPLSVIKSLLFLFFFALIMTDKHGVIGLSGSLCRSQGIFTLFDLQWQFLSHDTVFWVEFLCL
jgi:hypothetical protein